MGSAHGLLVVLQDPSPSFPNWMFFLSTSLNMAAPSSSGMGSSSDYASATPALRLAALQVLEGRQRFEQEDLVDDDAGLVLRCAMIRSSPAPLSTPRDGDRDAHLLSAQRRQEPRVTKGHEEPEKPRRAQTCRRSRGVGGSGALPTRRRRLRASPAPGSLGVTADGVEHSPFRVRRLRSAACGSPIGCDAPERTIAQDQLVPTVKSRAASAPRWLAS